MANDLVSVRDLHKVFQRGGQRIDVLQGVNLDIPEGDYLSLMGPSGSGKTTLLNLIGGLDAPTGGAIKVDGRDISRMGRSDLADLRRDRIGFVFQAYNLIPTLTAEENITLPMDIAGTDVDRSWFDEVVDTVGLRDRLRHRPTELSGGQQQRVAGARALVSKPEIIFADEPTGNLDSKSGAELLDFLGAAVKEHGQTIVMVTHDAQAAAHADRVVFLADGNAVQEMREPTAEAILDEIKSLEI
jgi:putative ABC transport system ATP-binding protein